MLTLPELDLHGYSLPIVISILEEIGPPLEIAKVENEEQRGPLMVTLAMELSCVLIQLLFSQRCSKAIAYELGDFLEIRGGDRFKSKNRRLEELIMKRESLICWANCIESILVGSLFVDNVVNPKADGCVTERVGGDYLRWKNCASVAELKEVEEDARKNWIEYKAVVTSYKSVTRMIDDISERLISDRKALLESHDFNPAFIEHLKNRGIDKEAAMANPAKKRIAIDFDIKHSVLDTGASAILAKTDRAWWRQFVNKSTKKINATGKKGFAMIMLRDSKLAEAAKEVCTNDKNIMEEDAWIKVLREPDTTWNWPSYLGRQNRLNGNAIRRKLCDLGKADEIRHKWIHDKGGAIHPCYSFWRNRSAADFLPKSSIDTLKKYPIEQATNELYWCLCHNSSESFRPFSSLSYPKGRWNTWLETANRGNPKFWVRN
jgi:hypothetical protein